MQSTRGKWRKIGRVNWNYLSKENGLLANLLREEYLHEFRGAVLDASSEQTLSEVGGDAPGGPK